MAFCAAAPALAAPLRIATYNAGLSRNGPGLLFRAIQSEKDPQVEAVADTIAALGPDVLLLTGVDWDHDLLALRAFAARLSARGQEYPHLFALRPNSGLASGQDLDGDGRLGDPRDAQGYGRFLGEGGMALLSRLPVDRAGVRDFSDLLWADLPGALIAGAGLSGAAAGVHRLSSTGHWDVPLKLPGGGVLHLWAYHATPPVFDGPEDRNGRRNHDETAFWLRYLDAELPAAPAPAPFVILGDANLDPDRGEGRHAALRALLSHPRVQDVDSGPTVDWSEIGLEGARRVDYVLPSAGVMVVAAGVLRPDPPGNADPATRHWPVWVDITLP